MNQEPVRRATLALGVFLTVVGVLLLFWTQNVIDGLVKWWPVINLVVGSILLFKSWFRKGRATFVFVGMLLFLSGLFILILNNLPPGSPDVQELWPVFMGIVGASLLPYANRFRRTIRISLAIPGLILLVMMPLFLLFSLQIVKQSFAQFVIGWWPLILVCLGLTLVVSAWAGRRE